MLSESWTTESLEWQFAEYNQEYGNEALLVILEIFGHQLILPREPSRLSSLFRDYILSPDASCLCRHECE